MFDPPPGQTCGVYMADFLGSNDGYLENGNATAACRYCPYETGAEYAKTFNLNEKYYSWRDVSGPGLHVRFGSLTLATRRLVSRRSFASRRMRSLS